MTTPDAGPRYLVLQGSDADDAGRPCWLCAEACLAGYPFMVALDLEPGSRFGFLCTGCARVGAPHLAAAVEALNLLAAVVGDLEPGHALRIGGGLLQLAGQLAIPRVLIANLIHTEERNQHEPDRS